LELLIVLWIISGVGSTGLVIPLLDKNEMTPGDYSVMILNALFGFVTIFVILLLFYLEYGEDDVFRNGFSLKLK